VTARLVDIVPAGCLLGEGIQWNAADQALWWTDIEGRRLWRHPLGGASTQFEMPERLCAFAFTDMSGRLLAAFESGLAFLDLEAGQPQWIARVEKGGSGRRFNDGRADRQGRFWVGTMVEDANRAGADSAQLYCLDRAGSLSAHASGIAISNGLCWSPDGGTLYFADSPKREIHAWDFDPATGQLGARRLFARTPVGAFPDGANVDSEGGVWSAHWGAGQVVRYTPQGRVDEAIAVAAPQPTCIAFGGPDLKLLCVSTARMGLSALQLAAAPRSGDVFIYELDIAGLAENRYEGDRVASAM